MSDVNSIMTNKRSGQLFRLGFGAQLSDIIDENYWGTGGGIGLQLSGVYNNEAAMYAALGNPPGAEYIGKYYAYLNPDGITWTVVKVVG